MIRVAGKPQTSFVTVAGSRAGYRVSLLNWRDGRAEEIPARRHEISRPRIITTERATINFFLFFRKRAAPSHEPLRRH